MPLVEVRPRLEVAKATSSGVGVSYWLRRMKKGSPGWSCCCPTRSYGAMVISSERAGISMLSMVGKLGGSGETEVEAGGWVGAFWSRLRW